MFYDLIVIGGGPTGMMAAGRAAELGAQVLLLEKNKNLGIKLLSTGHSRCNLSNAVPIRELINSFGENGKFLFSAFSKFGPEEVIDFFNERGLETKIEKNNRVFPKSDKSADVLKTLAAYLKENKVKIIFEANVKKITEKNQIISKVSLVDGREFSAKNYLIATGGLSYPTTGSTGDAYKWLKSLGHKIIKTYPALAPMIVREKFVKELEGLSLVDAEFTLKKDDKILNKKRGEAIFTADGLSGPVIFALSANAAKNLPEVELIIDLMPEKKLSELDQYWQEKFNFQQNKQIKNVLGEIFPSRLAEKILEIAGIDLTAKINQINKFERKKICAVIKNLNFKIIKVAGYDKAMLTTGGLDLKEVDQKTMSSKLIKNLLVAGEVLDLDGPTGGFNLQACWSTGRLAGESALITNG
ncbi:MAG: NAD(P)/FAD-dependent oxidoreductase [Patescibacteria group bacterium]|nr:NAD(P)/FAD-dependent oxidoreductase [Patescibacteria group bacterium]